VAIVIDGCGTRAACWITDVATVC